MQPSEGQGYPPGGQGYPPASQGYPPSGHGYPPSGQSGGYPPGGDAPGAPIGPQHVYPTLPQGEAPQGSTGTSGQRVAEPFEPPPGFLDSVPGYDSITFDDIPLAPPRMDDSVKGVEPKDRKPLSGLKEISQDEAKAALLDHASSNCCYGKAAAQEMTISNMSSTAVLRFTLETFTELRATAWAQAPFTGHEPLDTAMNGTPPQPWDIPLTAKEKFKPEKRLVEVPHTASVKPCHKCNGAGSTVCTVCQGQGKKQCSQCSGRGTQTAGGANQPCSFCHGSGKAETCTNCSGTGQAKCATCKGHRQLKWFVQLTITWNNHMDDFIPERTSLPDEQIRTASGQVAFQEEQPWLYPINHSPEASINKASADLIEKHRKAFPNERLLLQRQTIRVVPVTQVTCQWKQSPFTFYVFGLESKVYSADYPQQWCCGCSIL